MTNETVAAKALTTKSTAAEQQQRQTPPKPTASFCFRKSYCVPLLCIVLLSVRTIYFKNEFRVDFLAYIKSPGAEISPKTLPKGGPKGGKTKIQKKNRRNRSRGKAAGSRTTNTNNWPPKDQIKAIAGTDNTIVLIAVNCENVDFADNLINSILSFGVHSFVLLPLDSKAHDILKQYYPNNTIPQLPGLEGVDASGSGYASESFKAIVHARPRIILSFLDLNVNVLYNDADMVWKSNILKDMQSKKRPHVDFVIADDQPSFGKDCRRSRYLCTCNMLFPPSKNNKLLMRRWEARLKNNGKDLAHGGAVNQFAFNEVLRAAKKQFKYTCLNAEDGYPSGGQYFKNATTDAQRTKAKVVHNNYIEGKDNKLQRFQDHGLWNLATMGKSQLSCSN